LKSSINSQYPIESPEPFIGTRTSRLFLKHLSAKWNKRKLNPHFLTNLGMPTQNLTKPTLKGKPKLHSGGAANLHVKKQYGS
jgi:hypothetical protein